VEKTVRSLEKYFTVVRIMEYMIAGSNQPILKEIYRDIDRCDIYVILIGKLYGSIAPDTGLSFTENEFDRAVQQDKYIVPLFAHPNAPGLENIEADDQANYDRFVAKVRSKRLRFADPFTSADQLIQQLVLAFFWLSDVKWDVDEVRYLCNRSTQVTDFRSGRLQDRYISACIARRSDQSRYLTFRLAMLEVGLPAEYIPKLRPAIMMGGSGRQYEKFEERICTEMLTSLGMTGTDKDLQTVEKLFDFLAKKQVPALFVEMVLDTIEITETNFLFSHLQTLLANLRRYSAQTGIVAYCFVVLELEDEEDIGKYDLSSLNCPPGMAFSYQPNILDPLKKISRTDMRLWIQDHVTIHGNQIADEVLKEYFLTPAATISMGEISLKMGRIIDKINQQLQALLHGD